MDASFLIKCIDEVHDVIIKNEKEIESLDRAIGDGDHFINLKRGCIAIQFYRYHRHIMGFRICLPMPIVVFFPRMFVFYFSQN